MKYHFFLIAILATLLSSPVKAQNIWTLGFADQGLYEAVNSQTGEAAIIGVVWYSASKVELTLSAYEVRGQDRGGTTKHRPGDPSPLPGDEDPLLPAQLINKFGLREYLHTRSSLTALLFQLVPITQRELIVRDLDGSYVIIEKPSRD